MNTEIYSSPIYFYSKHGRTLVSIGLIFELSWSIFSICIPIRLFSLVLPIRDRWSIIGDDGKQCLRDVNIIIEKRMINNVSAIKAHNK